MAAAPKRTRRPDMYEFRASSNAQRNTLAIGAALWLAACWWLLFHGGLAMLGHWFGRQWVAGGQLRRLLLLGALSVYLARLLFAWFLFLKRGLRWAEVGAVLPWLLCIFLTESFAAGLNPRAVGITATIGVVLFLAGSSINTFAEYQRHKWKQHPEHHERLYTGGLFRFSRHPNYLGDVVSFTGLCMIAGSWATAWLPVVLLGGFIFANIPALDAHLHNHYGAEFDAYARRTSKLIPFLY